MSLYRWARRRGEGVSEPNKGHTVVGETTETTGHYTGPSCSASSGVLTSTYVTSGKLRLKPASHVGESGISWFFFSFRESQKKNLNSQLFFVVPWSWERLVLCLHEYRRQRWAFVEVCCLRLKLSEESFSACLSESGSASSPDFTCSHLYDPQASVVTAVFFYWAAIARTAQSD